MQAVFSQAEWHIFQAGSTCFPAVEIYRAHNFESIAGLIFFQALPDFSGNFRKAVFQDLTRDSPDFFQASTQLGKMILKMYVSAYLKFPGATCVVFSSFPGSRNRKILEEFFHLYDDLWSIFRAQWDAFQALKKSFAWMGFPGATSCFSGNFNPRTPVRFFRLN